MAQKTFSPGLTLDRSSRFLVFGLRKRPLRLVGEPGWPVNPHFLIAEVVS